MRHVRGARGLLVFGLFLVCALLLWGLGLAFDPFLLMLITGAWVAVSVSLVHWPWAAVAPVAALALAAPALRAQPLPVFLSEAFLLGGITLVLGGATFVVRRQSARRREHRQVELSYGLEVFENSLNILHVIDREGNVLRRNRRSFELLGWPHRKTLHITEYVHPEDLDHFRIDLERLFERGELRDLRLRFLKEDRGFISVEAQARRITGKLAVFEARDLSEIQQLKKELAEERVRYRHLIEHGIDALDVGVILVDGKGQVLWANKALGKFFGLDREEWIGNPALRLLERISMALEDGEDFFAAVKEAYHGGGEIAGFSVQVRPGRGREERVLQYFSVPLQTSRGREGRVDYFADVTALKKLEAELRHQKELLEEANERLRTFNAAVSHDLRTPARAALGYIQLVLSQHNGAIPEEIRRDLESAKGRLERIDRMLEDLSRYSKMRLDPTQFEPIDLNKLLEDVREDLDLTLSKAEIRLAPDLPQVYGRPSLIGELFANLIHNAVKFNDKPNPVVEVGWKPHRGDTYLFWVRDNGPGIPSEYLEKIFRLFEQLDRTKEGTGAGLAICRRIVEEHGGRIWAESQLGQGTTFYFTLPKPPLRKGVESDAR
ncbi:PAS domain S-box protein [Candidatus Bipolaricaulota bacterium]|nr:PAS domain S-box protein [Candidatus Bipolaricaulota bacterium]